MEEIKKKKISNFQFAFVFVRAWQVLRWKCDSIPGKAGNPIYRKVVGRLTMRQQHAKYSNNLVRRSARDRASNNTGNDMESGLIGERR